MLSHLLLAIGLSASVGLGASVNRANASVLTNQYPTDTIYEFKNYETGGGNLSGDFYNDNIAYKFDGQLLTCNYANLSQDFNDTEYITESTNYTSYPYGNFYQSPLEYRCFFVARNKTNIYPQPGIIEQVTPTIQYEQNTRLVYNYDTNIFDYLLLTYVKNTDNVVTYIKVLSSTYFFDEFDFTFTLQTGDSRLDYFNYDVNANMIYINGRYEGYIPLDRGQTGYTDHIDFFSITLIGNAKHGNLYNAGYSNGHDTGYEDGFNNGFYEGANSSTTFLSLLGAIADTPLLMLRSLFNFDLFGINLLFVILSLITGLFVFYLVRKYLL